MPPYLFATLVDCDHMVQQKVEMGTWCLGYLQAEANRDLSILRWSV